MKRVLEILARISCMCLEKEFTIIADYDNKYTTFKDSLVSPTGRIYLQAHYTSKCTKTGTSEKWKGRKNYLSDHMTDDEIIKTAYVTFKQAVEHEIMEGFKVDDTILFNPHVSYEALLEISNKEVSREEKHSPLKIV